MKTHPLALALLLFTATLPSLADAPATQPADITINITDKAGKPIEAAQISVLSPDGSHIDATTDANGKATLTGYNGKPATVMIAHPDCVGVSQTNAVLKNGTTAKLTTQRNVGSIIFPEGTGNIPGLSGLIRSDSDPFSKKAGDPLSKNTYRFDFFPHVASGERSYGTRLTMGSPTTLTDEKKATYRITPQALPTGKTIMITYEILKQPPTTQPADITVTITDKAGKPIEAAQISVLSPDGSHIDATTDAHGKATLSGYDGKPASVMIAHPDYVGVSQTNAALKNGTTAKLTTQHNVGSIIFPEGDGAIPGLSGNIRAVGDHLSKNIHDFDFFPHVGSGQRSYGTPLTMGNPTTLTDENKATYRITPQAFPAGTTIMITYEKLTQPNANK